MRRLWPLLVPVVLLLATGAGLSAKPKPKPKPKLVTVLGQAFLDKKPMAGAIVRIAGKKATADKKGKFKVRIRPGSYIPVVTYKGKEYRKGDRPITFGSYPVQHLDLWFWTRDQKEKSKEAGIAPASLSYLLTHKEYYDTIFTEGSFLAVNLDTDINLRYIK